MPNAASETYNGPIMGNSSSTTVELSMIAQPPQRLRLVYSAQGVLSAVSEFADTETEREFKRLAQQWHHETGHLSVVFRKAMHPAYQRIIGMGYRVVALILRDLEQNGGYWFWALNAITGEDPLRRDSTYTQSVRAWLAWGKERNLIP